MAIITLTTDWNKSDYYLGTVKGKILSKDSNIRIVDISHQVQPFSIMEAAFIIRNSCFNFPEGTIHIIAVNAANTKKQSLLIIESGGQYFISSDSGIVGLITTDKPDAVYRVKDTEGKMNFLDMDAYIQAAFKLIDQKSPGSFCEKTDDYESQTPYRPVIDKNLINGSVIYIDSFSNAITNVSRETFDKVGQGKAFEILVQSNRFRLDRISTGYSKPSPDGLVALFNSIDLLEIAFLHGDAASLMNLSINSTVRIKFFNEKPKNKLELTGG